MCNINFLTDHTGRRVSAHWQAGKFTLPGGSVDNFAHTLAGFNALDHIGWRILVEKDHIGRRVFRKQASALSGR